MIKNVSMNSNWDGVAPYVSIVTPVFNRALTMPRTIASIEAQTYRNFEYIIVDDGSTDDIDSIVFPFMNSTNIPVLYIKKDNGGVHTARNAGLNRARGFLYIELDSDDELLPSALQTFVDVWNTEEVKKDISIREVVAQCVNEKGERCGEPFPSGINNFSLRKSHFLCNATKGEHIGCSLTSVRKAHPYPEPEGVTFYTESILWVKLDTEYRSYYINDVLRIYHSEGDDHLNTELDKTRKRKSVQSCRNGLWECCYVLNNWNVYKGNGFNYLSNMLRYSVLRHALKKRKDVFCTKYRLMGLKNRIVYACLSPAVVLYSIRYEKDRM